VVDVLRDEAGVFADALFGLVLGHGALDAPGEGLDGAGAREGVAPEVVDAFAARAVALEAELLVNRLAGVLLEVDGACPRCPVDSDPQGSEQQPGPRQRVLGIQFHLGFGFQRLVVTILSNQAKIASHRGTSLRHPIIFHELFAPLLPFRVFPRCFAEDARFWILSPGLPVCTTPPMFPISLQFYLSAVPTEEELREAFVRTWFPKLRWGALGDLMAHSDDWPDAILAVRTPRIPPTAQQERDDTGSPEVSRGFRTVISLPQFPRRNRHQNPLMRATKLALLRMLSAHFECRVACDGTDYRSREENELPGPFETFLCVGGRIFCGELALRDLGFGEVQPAGGWAPLDEAPTVALLPDARIAGEADAVRRVEAWCRSRPGSPGWDGYEGGAEFVPGASFDDLNAPFGGGGDEEDEEDDFDEPFSTAGAEGQEDDEDDSTGPWGSQSGSLFAGPFSNPFAESAKGESDEEDADSLDEYFTRLEAWLQDDVGTTASKQLISRQISLPPPDSLEDEALHEKLWEVIRGMAGSNTFLHDTDHLTDRELYTWLWEEGLNEQVVDLSGLSDCACHTSPIGGGSESDVIVSLTYYDDAETRAEWRAEWPDEPVPAHRDPPADRDRLLPRRE